VVTIESVSDKVDLVIFGTSLKTGNCIAFRKSSIESSRFDDDSGCLKIEATVPVNSVPLQYLIQGSAGFPPFFPPLQLNESIFESKPKLQELGQLFNEEVADGGIRDNLGLEWYKANINRSDNVLLVVSDAGQVFDWEPSNNTGQSINSWINRLLRAVNIQMNRLSQLDKLGHINHNNTKFVQFNDRRILPTIESTDLPAQYRTIPSGVAGIAESIPTDLVPIKNAQAYAIVRFGYDLAKLQMKEIYSEKAGKPGSLNDGDGFWKDLLPSGITCLVAESERDRSSSLVNLISNENNNAASWFYNPVSLYDYWRQLPLNNKTRWFLVVLSLTIAGLAAMGIRPTLAFGWSVVRPYVYTEPTVEYSDFVSKVQSMQWNDACKEIDSRTVVVRGKFLTKRGDVLTIKLDKLENLARVRLMDPGTASALPSDAAQNRDNFLVLVGRYRMSEYDTAALNLTSGELRSTLESRPESWDR
jgi:hypothetical protein